jgi:hypothetical protein
MAQRHTNPHPLGHMLTPAPLARCCIHRIAHTPSERPRGAHGTGATAFPRHCRHTRTTSEVGYFKGSQQVWKASVAKSGRSQVGCSHSGLQRYLLDLAVATLSDRAGQPLSFKRRGEAGLAEGWRGWLWVPVIRWPSAAHHMVVRIMDHGGCVLAVPY